MRMSRGDFQVIAIEIVQSPPVSHPVRPGVGQEHPFARFEAEDRRPLLEVGEVGEVAMLAREGLEIGFATPASGRGCRRHA